MRKPENHYLLYRESEHHKGFPVSNALHLDSLQSLIFELRQCELKGHTNVIIHTLVNARPKLTESEDQI